MFHIARHSPDWVLTAEQRLPVSLDKAFDYFSKAENLEVITPPWMHFHIVTPRPIELKTGALIDYRLKLHGIPINWQTKILEWSPPFQFVDSQLRGPYRKWVHTHTFEEIESGTLVRDHVAYQVWGGRIVHSLLVKNDLRKIFDYRERQLTAHFGDAPT